MSPPEEIITVLAVSAAADEVIFFDHFAAHSRWRVERVGTCSEAADYLRDHDVAVVLCSTQLPDGTWKNVVAEAGACKDHPRVIVVAGDADDQLWSEVLDLGGYDILLKPLDPRELVRVVSLAWRQWRDGGRASARAGLQPRQERGQLN